MSAAVCCDTQPVTDARRDQGVCVGWHHMTPINTDNQSPSIVELPRVFVLEDSASIYNRSVQRLVCRHSIA